MRTTIYCLLITVLCVSLSTAQVIPPINLNAELLQGGDVALTWDAPPEGLVEDFEDGAAQSFEWFVGNGGSYVIEDGYAKIDQSAAGDWGSGVYTALAFDNFTVSVTFEYVTDDLSRGLLFRGDGPKDDDYTGYGFWVAHTLDSYSMYKYTNGSISNVIPWTGSDLINEGPGAINTLSITAIGSTFDMYVNDTYVGSATDGDHASGFSGIVTAYDNVVWFDDITTFYETPRAVPTQPAQPGTPLAGLYNDLGQPVDEPFAPSTDAVVFDRSMTEPTVDELDEFIEYKVYRDGELLGSTVAESYTDDLPGLGEFEYTVTALYDEGESSHAGPALVNWEAVILDLIGQIVEVPAEGGTIYYDATLINTLQRSFNNVDYWTEVELPNGQLFGPLMLQPIVIPGFFNVTVLALSQYIPPESLGGTYIFTGHVGRYPTSYLNDSFPFEKLGNNSDWIEFNPDHWAAGGSFEIAGDDADFSVDLPSAFRLNEAYPNPFNASTSFSIDLPESAELVVTVYNISGQQVATLVNGTVSAGQHSFSFDASGMASGLYFIRATVPGQLDQIQKVTLIR
jgi:Secretion system C-terminal sorting domain/3-keto-disaccharide hydrolase